MVQKIMSRAMRCLVGNRSVKGIKFSKQGKYYRQLKKAQWENCEKNVVTQKQRLYDIVQFALREVPYYRELGMDANKFSVDTIFDDIKKFPILTKKVIREQGERLYPDHMPKDWTFINTSGGTTGEPVKFRHSGTFFDYDQAGKLLYDEWTGRGLGEKQVCLWGSERDIIAGKKDWMNKIYRWCRNEVFLNSFRMSDELMTEYVAQINKKKPKMILAYVQSVRELAQHIEKNKLEIYSPKGIMTSAGNLDENTRVLLARVFRCPITNRYGSREMGDMACDCGKSEGLHINVFTTYAEILDDEWNDCKDEEVGNVVVTLLNDYSMPLIRYAIGDRGALTKRKCSCGRGWPLIKSINGRTVDVFRTKAGESVDGEYFTHLFYTQNNVKQFQVIQDAIEHVIIKLVLYDKDKATKEFYEDLEKNIKLVMGNGTEISYKIVDNIEVSKSGKRAYTICMLDGK